MILVGYEKTANGNAVCGGAAGTRLGFIVKFEQKIVSLLCEHFCFRQAAGRVLVHMVQIKIFWYALQAGLVEIHAASHIEQVYLAMNPVHVKRFVKCQALGKTICLLDCA